MLKLRLRWKRGGPRTEGYPQVARIAGTDPRYGLSRVFLSPVRVIPDEPGKYRTIVTLLYPLSTEGLFEYGHTTTKEYLVVWPEGCVHITETQAWAVARLLDTGLSARSAYTAVLRDRSTS
jgi:hypothetical protein